MLLKELEFEVPEELAATAPRETLGEGRAQTRLLILNRQTGEVAHTRVQSIGTFLRPDDLIVLNNSATLPAAMSALSADGLPIEVRLGIRKSQNEWHCVFEPEESVQAGMHLTFDGGNLTAKVVGQRQDIKKLWVVRFSDGDKVIPTMQRTGHPIRYYYVPQAWDLSYYQNDYATVPGSSEMPSAGRAFTSEVLTHLQAQGVQIAYITLHTGVSNIAIEEETVEEHHMYEEPYEVTPETAAHINWVRAHGGRVIAVGTTVTRTLETVADEQGVVQPGKGWTSIYITPGYHFKVLDGLVTGLHEPTSTRIVLAAAFAGKDLILKGYRAAIAEGYKFHEFGDLTLIL